MEGLSEIKREPIPAPEEYLTPIEQRGVANDIAHIASEIIKGHVSFLFGAGMSIGSNGITGRDLSFLLVKEAYFKNERNIKKGSEPYNKITNIIDKYSLEAIAEAAERNLPRNVEGLEEVLQKNVIPVDAKPHGGHTALASLSQDNKIQKIFTTNFDELIESEFSGGADPIFNLTDLRKLEQTLDSGKTAVIHLHGSYGKGPKIKESELMASTIKKHEPLFQLFLSELLTKVFVFVGYSLSDPNLRTIYFQANELLSKRKEDKKLTYIVSPIIDDFERQVASEIWDTRGAKLIPLDAERFMIMLLKETVDSATTEWKEDIAKRLGIDKNTLDSKIEMILGMFPNFGSTEQILRYFDAISRKPNK